MKSPQNNLIQTIFLNVTYPKSRGGAGAQVAVSDHSKMFFLLIFGMGLKTPGPIFTYVWIGLTLIVKSGSTRDHDVG